MFKIINNEQTPEVAELENPKDWINENKKLVHEFLSFAKSQHNAVGLAANQLSKDDERFMERMFASKAKGEGDGEWQVFINPKVTKKHGNPISQQEGCLTWPNKKVVADRHLKIDVEWFDQKGEQHSAELSGWEAQVWQHEQDHLDGVEEEVFDKKSFQVRSNKIGRNDPCPCGALRPDGKPMKYKKCCGK